MPSTNDENKKKVESGSGTSLKDKLKAPFQKLEEKLEGTHLHDAKIHITHKKHQIGKFANLFNRNHRHDEEHEQATDDKRQKIRDEHRYDSFFPERDGNIIKWYVDGRDYFWAVSEALEAAQETIYICDWWLSPELFLRRPPHDNQQWRLDQVLKRRAEAGVKIYVTVYREVEAALTCNSAHTKHALHGLCPEGSPGYGNIKVMRHPDHNVLENAADMTLYWAHHEKFIVIDYRMAFIGGLDLCFGRWDTQTHALADVHPEGVKNEVWPGQDFNNNRVMDFKNVDDWKQNELSKTRYGRMPWHDVSMGVIGPCVYDIAEHFVLRWNFIKRDKYKRDDRYDWIQLAGRTGEDEDLVGVQRPKHPVGEYLMHPLTPLETKNLENRGTVHAQIVRSSDDWSSGILLDHSIQNAYSKTILEAEHYVYIENQFFITATGEHQSPVHNTIGLAIVQAVLRAAEEKRKFRIIVCLPAIPGFAGDLRDEAAMGTRAIMDYQYKSICRGEHSIFEQIKAKGVNPREYIFFFNLRSYDRLVTTPALLEQEKKTGVSYQQVQRAEAEEIMAEGIHGAVDPTGHGERDEHMGSAQDQDPNLATPEVEKALDAKQRFEAAMPEGKLTAAPSLAHHAMAGNERSLLDEPWDDEDLETEIQNWVQEELYIHSKLLIADDRIVICGSSNLNDRSQLGLHDIKNFDDYDRYLPPKGIKSGHVYDLFMPAEDARKKIAQIKGHLVWFPLEFLRDAEMAETGLQVNHGTNPGHGAHFASLPTSSGVVRRLHIADETMDTVLPSLGEEPRLPLASLETLTHLELCLSACAEILEEIDYNAMLRLLATAANLTHLTVRFERSARHWWDLGSFPHFPSVVSIDFTGVVDEADDFVVSLRKHARARRRVRLKGCFLAPETLRDPAAIPDLRLNRFIVLPCKGGNK
ncbi:phospholipase D p2 [Verticillium alfalfae VaMs.102]|uniref:phospholipase D n=1 Tax=Verticillium alfalfae (strain VaMs.102 / ATCC MYA-4576 / FGSC 10136) TaxID=526221 RepID=C9STZ0_VERA1|nr:phospholipase D p2 [Verticillium alfalfae VaMs.102]EEY22301.1 phospholipase D p2 [Verticillium alfalfae VaMs.102]